MISLLFALIAVVSAAPARVAPRASDAPDWERTLDAVIPAVVSIRVNATRSFDTESARSAYATGFVVDAERGLILTNRHVVNPGPVVAEAVFLDHEEVSLVPVYRDPVHDFGIFQYDPAAVHFMKPVALTLAPGSARVGLDVRVVGNDAGEKVSILAGTISRLDRPAPEYGLGNFNDFNTFYIQAATGTSGGSSGSPVIDEAGEVVALNAGGSRSAASSYYLPLDRVVRALDAIKAGRPVARGTLQTIFAYTPYDEVRRLGLSPETEAALRAANPDAIGALVVSEVLPGGPGAGALEPGDVVIRLQGELCASFLTLEQILDEAVGGEVALELQRGGETRQVRVRVGDAHAASPDAYLEYAGGTLTNLSMMLARGHAVPLSGVFVASSLYGLSSGNLTRGSVITAIDGKPTPDIAAFEAVLSAYPHGARVSMRLFDLTNPRLEQVVIMQVDRQWFPMRRCKRDDATGLWPCADSPAPPAALAQQPADAPVPVGSRQGRKLAKSLVSVTFSVPYRVEGIYGTRFRGTGLILDPKQGLVLVDRDTVPMALGDVSLIFGGALEVPGQVVYIHPVHNIAIIRYDPVLLGDTPLKAARLAPGPAPKEDSRIWQVGLNVDHKVVARRTRLDHIDALRLPLPSPPFFRDTNIDAWAPRDWSDSIGGVLADRRGRVLAQWASFADLSTDTPRGQMRGLPAELVADVTEPLLAGQTPVWRGLGAELAVLNVADARARGLSAARAAAVEAHAPRRPNVLVVVRTTVGLPADSLLEEGDLLLAADGQTVTTFREVEVAAQAETVRLTVLRSGAEQEIAVPTADLGLAAVDRAVVWAGALLHAPTLAVRAQRGVAGEGVYVAWNWFGSPASRYRLSPTKRIVAVDGKATPDLDAFLAVVADRPDGSPLRLATLDLDGKADVITLKLDLAWWPTTELKQQTDGSWSRAER